MSLGKVIKTVLTQFLPSFVPGPVVRIQLCPGTSGSKMVVTWEGTELIVLNFVLKPMHH
jgi:hypothetical protein